MLKTKLNFPSREDLVYSAIRERVLNGDFKPSEVVNQTDMADQLGVSIIPVRNAISRLVAEGLLSQDPYHSPQVLALTKENLDEVLFIALHLEVLATRAATPHIDAKELDELRSLVDEMSAAIDQNELLHYGLLNRTFHMAIYKSGPYPRLRLMISDLWIKADIHRYRAMFDLVPELAQHSQAEHIRLLHLIESRQVDEAARLMEEHKNYSRNCYLLAFDEMNKTSQIKA